MRRPKAALILALLLCIALVGFLAYRSPWVRSIFTKDTVDTAELSKLAETKFELPAVAEPSTGWPQWRGPFRDGRAPAGPLRTDWDNRPPKLVWRAPCGGGFSSLAVVNGQVYTQDRQGGNERVFCLNAENGKQLWEYSYPSEPAGEDRNYSSGPRATPTVQGNLVYVVSGAGLFLCLEAPQGNPTPKVVWQHNLLSEFDAQMPKWGVASSPLIEGDLAIVQPGGKNGSVVAFDKTSGEIRWRAGTNPSGYSSPIAATIGGQRTVFALTGNALLAIGLGGLINDSFPWATQFDGNVATPLIVDDYIFISAAYGQGCALLRAQRNNERVKLIQVYARHVRGLKNHHSTSVYKDRYIYGFDGEGAARLKCIEFNTGNEKTDWEATGIDKGSLILAENYLIVQTERGDLCLVEATPAEFRLLARIPKVLSGSRNWTAPTLVDGKLYLRDEEKIACYDVGP